MMAWRYLTIVGIQVLDFRIHVTGHSLKFTLSNIVLLFLENRSTFINVRNANETVLIEKIFLSSCFPFTCVASRFWRNMINEWKLIYDPSYFANTPEIDTNVNREVNQTMSQNQNHSVMYESLVSTNTILSKLCSNFCWKGLFNSYSMKQRSGNGYSR